MSMSMETAAWQSLYTTMHAAQDQRPFSPAALRRIAGFARPHGRRILVFVMTSVLIAVVTVSTPLLAGRVVDAIVGGQAPRVVIVLAAVIAAIALAEAGLGLAQRWFSANIGEGLILDLRTAVYDHVQRMPIAFFGRTRTGALVSRLNNDVIGAQRAFSETLSGVVSNVVTLVLAAIAMVALSWQVTLATLVLLPLFVLPARRLRARLARLQRAAASHNSTTSTQIDRKSVV